MEAQPRFVQGATAEPVSEEITASSVRRRLIQLRREMFRGEYDNPRSAQLVVLLRSLRGVFGLTEASRSFFGRRHYQLARGFLQIIEFLDSKPCTQQQLIRAHALLQLTDDR